MTYPENEPGLETPVEDAAEQATLVWTDEAEEEQADPLSFEAPEWDAQEQRQAVIQDDDYR